MAVMKSLMHEARVRPRTGWVRADQARTDEDRQREIRLQQSLEEAQEEITQAQTEIEELRRALRDGAVLVDEVPRDRLSQGSDLFSFTIMFRDESKNMVAEQVPVSWDDIFRTIGPSMYGYIMRKAEKFNSRPAYSFEENLENLLRSMVIHRAQGRKIDIQEGQVDSCVFQFKELGYIRFDEKKKDDGSVFRGITLTQDGERYLSLLKTAQR